MTKSALNQVFVSSDFSQVTRSLGLTATQRLFAFIIVIIIIIIIIIISSSSRICKAPLTEAQWRRTTKRTKVKHENVKNSEIV